MFIVTIDFTGALKRADVPEFLSGIRKASFGAIPEEVRQANGLDPETDCIAIHLDFSSKTFLGRILKPITSGKFPGFLAAICFSAKPVYIPHDPAIIAAIATAAPDFLKSSGIKGAAWAIPFVLGKWVAT